MWQFNERYADQDILEFQSMAAAQGWNGNHSLLLKEYAKGEEISGYWGEQKQACHAAGFLHPVEQTSSKIKKWIKLLEELNG